MGRRRAATVRQKIATVGITAFAVEALTDLVFIELPKVGRQVKAGESFGEIESVKAVSDLYARSTAKSSPSTQSLPDNLETLAATPTATAGSSRSRSPTRRRWRTCWTTRRIRSSVRRKRTSRSGCSLTVSRLPFASGYKPDLRFYMPTSPTRPKTSARCSRRSAPRRSTSCSRWSRPSCGWSGRWACRRRWASWS